jgi:hypothetical protein
MSVGKQNAAIGSETNCVTQGPTKNPTGPKLLIRWVPRKEMHVPDYSIGSRDPSHDNGN